MRSPGSGRAIAEWCLRGALVGLLALALLRSFDPPGATAVARSTTVRDLPRALDEATRSARVVTLSLDVDSMPGSVARDWLAALRRAGVAVQWHGTPPSLAVQAERGREPDGRVRVTVVADGGRAIALTDSAGALDSLRVTPRGATLDAPAVVGAVRAARGRFVARAMVPPARAPRAVLVLGRAGWESKFVATALQESGWTVRARLPAAPGVAITDAGLLPIDTARYAVVIALDSSAADLGPAIARFVEQGGGMILAGAAPMLPAVRALTPALVGARLPGRLLLDGDTVTRADLPHRALESIRPDAIRLESTTSPPLAVVRRAGLGRVVVIGYDETWRWRMLGGTGGVGAHRAWWSRMAGIVAPEPADTLAPAGADAAPLAALHSALGAPSAEPLPVHTAPDDRWHYLMLIAIVALLLGETASRRFRGAR